MGVLLCMIFENFLFLSFFFFLIENFSHVLRNTHMATCSEEFHGYIDK